jgi:hypothetical protein
MSAAAIIERVRASGGEITLAADGIKLRVPASLRDQVVAEVKAHKPEVKHLLKIEAGDPWDAGDYCACFDEAAGVAEVDHGRSLPEAEAYAFESCVTEWLNRNFEQSRPGQCAACGSGELAHDPLLPFGTERTGHVWLHARCQEVWHARRKAKAIAALAEFGISNPRPITAAEAIKRRLVFEYVTGKIPAADD